MQNYLFESNNEDFKEELNALDKMFAASRRYRSSAEYMNMLNFICRLPKYSPFNCFLLYTQNPAVSYVATAIRWQKKFKRRPKRDARPLVILAPNGPVCFVYDLKDTKGKPPPKYVERPFETEGHLDEIVFDRTVHNCGVQAIEVREILLGHHHGGSAVKLTEDVRKKYNDLKLSPSANYLIFLNKESVLKDKYSSLVHELGHIFCGHIGIDEEAWWQDRSKMGKTVVEIEAESVSFLVCRRKDLIASSDKYLSNYNTLEDQEIPPLSVNAILQATSYIEDMGKSEWKKPKKKSRYKTDEE